MVTLEEKVQRINELLDSYEEQLGLPKFDKYGQDIKKYLDMSHSELQALTPMLCAEISVILTQYAFYIQRAINRETAILNWAKKNLTYSVAPKAKQYKGSFAQQEAQAVMDDEFCKKLITLISKAEQRTDRLQFLANNIKAISEQLNRLQQAKMARA